MHVVDLIEADFQKEFAKINQAFVRKVSPAVVITLPLGVCSAQGLHIAVPVAGQASTDIPKSITANWNKLKAGVCIEPRDPAVAIKERMNPHQPVVGRRNGNHRRYAMVATPPVKITKPLQEQGDIFMGRADMFTDFDVPMPQLPTHNIYYFFCLRMPYFL
jgi:hypothetical protein